MNITFYTGMSGMVAFQQGMDLIAHNISNSNTTGYKSSRMQFRDLLYTEMYTNEDPKPLNGHGVKAFSADLIYRTGKYKHTENPLDFALLSEGFFAVQNKDGEIEYTRNGIFNIGMQSRSTGNLVTTDGRYVLDNRKRPIVLKKNDSGTFDTDTLPDKIGVFNFANPHGLQVTDGSSFLPTDNSGAAEALKNYELRSGTLEESSVEIAEEMVNMIVTQRAYQLSAKMIRTADEMEEIANNLR